MKIKLECKDITYDLIEELKQKVDREPNDISSWKSLVELLEIKIRGLEGQIKVLEERQEMLVETNNGLGEEIADLEKENKRLKKQNKILSHNSTNILMTDTKVMKRNLELQTENEKLKEEINELSKDELCFEKRCDKLEKAIELLKFYFNFNFNDQNLGLKIFSKIACDGKGTSNCIQAVENYSLLKEVLGE